MLALVSTEMAGYPVVDSMIFEVSSTESSPMLCPYSSASSDAIATSVQADPGGTIFGVSALTRPSMFVTVPARS